MTELEQQLNEALDMACQWLQVWNIPEVTGYSFDSWQGFKNMFLSQDFRDYDEKFSKVRGDK